MEIFLHNYDYNEYNNPPQKARTSSVSSLFPAAVVLVIALLLASVGMVQTNNAVAAAAGNAIYKAKFRDSFAYPSKTIEEEV
jgi:hypothetical protein